MSTSITATQLYEKWLIELTFNLPKENYANVLPIFAIDESGSMCCNLAAVVNGARQLINSYLENNCPEVVVVRYHTTATSFSYHTLSEANSFYAHAQGMTNFPAAIDKIVAAIDRANRTKRQARLYFMTDGQNTVDGAKLPQSKSKLHQALTNATVPATIDVIGFTGSHDVNLLNEFARITGEGTFQYAETGESLEKIVSELLSVSGNKRTVDLTWGGQTIRVTAIRDEDATFRVIQQVSQAPSTEVQVHITGRDPVYLPMIKKELTEETRTRFQVQSIRETLQDLAQRANQLGTTADRSKFDTDLRAVDSEIDNLVGSGDLFRDMNREQRRLIRQTHLEFKETISQLYNARQEHLSTREYASLLSSTTSFITKTGLQKKLQQRVLSNISNDDHVLAKERGELLQFVSPPVDESQCMLTLDNYQELAKQGDCLCICLSISRTQSAIADPSQVRIHKIQPTLLSLDAFRDTVDFQLIATEDKAAVHGGFQRSLGKSSTVIEGMAREKINAVFPVYFDETSWAVTRLRMKEAFSWMATITWNGWSFSQLEILPAMVLAHALREYNSTPSSLYERIVNLLAATYRAVSTSRIDAGVSPPATTTQAGGLWNFCSIADRQLAMLSKFMNSPINRTVDMVPSLQALVGIAYALDNDTYKSRYFIEFLWEEYFRRELRWQQSNVEAEQVMKTIAKKLHIDLDKYTQITITAGSGGAEASMIREELGLNITDTQQTMSKQTDEKWDWSPIILPGDIQQAQQVWVMVNGWFSREPRSFLGDDICLALTIQNMLQATNSSRREALRGHTYISPFESPGVLIRAIGTKVINHFRELKWSHHVAAQGNDAAAEFATTTDLFQAAGLIKKKIDHFGHHNFCRFVKALTRPAEHSAAKIAMLLTGEFTYGKTARLLNYGWNEQGGPNRRWIHRWWLANGQNLSADQQEDWNRVLPNYKINSYWDELWERQL
uniref:von willebrand factor type A domain protein n=1 Tax=Marseillevirus LCMAC202 TaxID=2506606 RepID=A0A481Z006_9VIRU|nr:MAG: von willebrand factor type A domain protein [Marseillevirus LCMAC202]